MKFSDHCEFITYIGSGRHPVSYSARHKRPFEWLGTVHVVLDAVRTDEHHLVVELKKLLPKRQLGGRGGDHFGSN